MSVQFVCQRGVGGLFVFRFLICAGTPMYIREGGPVVHEQSVTNCRASICRRGARIVAQDVVAKMSHRHKM